MEIAPPAVLGPGTRRDLIQRVAGIHPMGGTNMYDGLRAGEARVAQAPATHPVRRVVVISDGMANIGPATPEALGEVAAQGTEYGAQVSAIGVGLEYDERTLAALAVRSAGRLYHLEQPEQMTAILRDELQLLASTVATDAYIEIAPAPGVEILGAESVQGEVQNGRLRVRLGSLYGGQHRELLVRARVNTAVPGEHALASARLVYRDPAARHVERAHSLALNYAVTADAAAAARTGNARVQTMVASVQAARAQLQAVELLNQGNNAQAARVAVVGSGCGGAGPGARPRGAAGRGDPSQPRERGAGDDAGCRARQCPRGEQRSVRRAGVLTRGAGAAAAGWWSPRRPGDRGR
jgi:Ca-activated chloride channel family protein